MSQQKQLRIFLFTSCFIFLSAKSFAGKLPSQAQTCAGCHGENGISNNPLWPNLAGQKKLYLIKQIKDFKGKHRKDQLMTPMANTLSEDDIEVIADYFSKLKGQ